VTREGVAGSIGKGRMRVNASNRERRSRGAEAERCRRERRSDGVVSPDVLSGHRGVVEGGAPPMEAAIIGAGGRPQAGPAAHGETTSPRGDQP
jgi:hypothetical protein